jgi:hypothetical protein
MIHIAARTLVSWKKPSSLTEATNQAQLGGALYAIYAILSNVQFAFVGQFTDPKIYLGSLGLDLAIAAGIWLNSRAFACLAVVLCFGRTISVYQFDTYQQMTLVLALTALGGVAAVAGLRGNFAFKRYGMGSMKSQLFRRALLAALTLVAVASVAWYVGIGLADVRAAG